MIAENTLSNDENAKLIKENVDAYFKAQKDKDVKGMEKYLPQELDQEIPESYLNDYFKNSDEKIGTVELKDVDFNTDTFDAIEDNFANYPAKNKAIISVTLTRTTNYLGTETRKVYEIPVVYRRSWEVIATDTLIPKQLASVDFSDTITAAVQGSAPLLHAGEIMAKTNITKVAVFDKHIVVRTDMETKSPDDSRIVGFTPFQDSLIDNEGQTYTYQYSDRKYYPSNSPGGDAYYNIAGKSTAWFSFIPKDEHTIGNKISKLAFQYAVGVTNFTIGQNKDYNNRKIEINLSN